MSARRLFGQLLRLMVFGLVALCPLMLASVKLGKMVEVYGLWIPSAGMGLAMFFTGNWATLVTKALFKSLRPFDLVLVWLFGFMVGGLYWAKDYGPPLLSPDVSPWNVLQVTAIVLTLFAFLAIGSWIGVVCFAGGRDAWREIVRRAAKIDLHDISNG